MCDDIDLSFPCDIRTLFHPEARYVGGVASHVPETEFRDVKGRIETKSVGNIADVLDRARWEAGEAGEVEAAERTALERGEGRGEGRGGRGMGSGRRRRRRGSLFGFDTSDPLSDSRVARGYSLPEHGPEIDV